MKRMVKKYGFDDSHFTGQCWNKDRIDYGRFRKGVVLKSDFSRKALLFMRGNICEQCGLMEWQGHPIPLEIHHIDGDSRNNELDNLRLLCRNCHGVTENFKATGIICRTKVSDDELIRALEENTSVHKALVTVKLSPKGGNYKRAYNLIHKYDIQVGLRVS